MHNNWSDHKNVECEQVMEKLAPNRRRYRYSRKYGTGCPEGPVDPEGPEDPVGPEDVKGSPRNIQQYVYIQQDLMVQALIYVQFRL
jgi:hypothetical protein